ncbi:hypothetical protein HYFRA_00000127 [Hymenoscyphus fraxineus]|uniref:Uncharacterized protein n=1 Tax=Hymenoscyphus fraxineus TaxID=746836 RepID=A0A9N9L2A4_9HELO|nr:hypothetical protein HYFRA_00000127 [Hymenoscyphus fraxineus]
MAPRPGGKAEGTGAGAGAGAIEAVSTAATSRVPMRCDAMPCLSAPFCLSMAAAPPPPWRASSASGHQLEREAVLADHPTPSCSHAKCCASLRRAHAMRGALVDSPEG